MTRSVVVLPDPDGPSIVKNSPSAMSRSRFSIATTSPNVRRMPLSRTAGVAAGASRAALTGACVAKRLLQNREPSLQLLVRRREWRQEPDHVSVEPAREEDEPLVARRRRHGFRSVAVLFRELEREHRAEAAYFADDRLPCRDLVEACAEERRDLLGATAEAGRRQLVEHGERRSAGDRVAAERAAEAAGVRR